MTTPERAREILDERARALARPVAAVAHDDAAAAREVVVVRIGGGAYALPLDRVVEIARAPGLVPIPGAVPPATALAAWRGRVITVLELGPRRAGAADDAAAPDAARRLVVVGESRAAFAIAVDAVEGVRALSDGEVRPPPEGLPLAHPELAAGVTADALVLLNAAALLQRFPRRN